MGVNQRFPYSTKWVAQLLELALASPGTPPVFGITGVQGCGKTTLAAQLVKAAKSRGLHAVALSIDDFYLTRRERLVLAQRKHPLLATRGPPGTHDVGLACRTLDALRKHGQGDMRLPRFDKISDRRLPSSHWRTIRQRPDLIIFDGWFLKVPPEQPIALGKPVNMREAKEDSEGCWRRYCNEALAGYAPLWQRLDRLLFLQSPDFAIVRRWRWQQEVTLQRAHPGRRAMTRAQVERFVLLFERVSRHARTVLPKIADITIRLDAQRRPLK